MQVLRNLHKTKRAILHLYEDMIAAYEEFSKDDLLQRCNALHGIYSSLFRQIIECAIFIEGYTKEGGISMFLSYNHLIIPT